MRKVAFLFVLVAIGTVGSTAFADPATDDPYADYQWSSFFDFYVEQPLGDFANVTGPMFGPTGGFAYRVIPQVQVYGRVGYMFDSAATTPEGGMSRISGLLARGGARVYFGGVAGLFVSGEFGLNRITPDTTGMSVNREGGTAAVGYMISRSSPYEILVQYSVLNVVGKEPGEPSESAVGIALGYTALQF
jgi:hypothetical protein